MNSSINEIVSAFEGLSLKDKKYTAEILSKSTLAAKRKKFEQKVLNSSVEMTNLRAKNKIKSYRNASDLIQALNED